MKRNENAVKNQTKGGMILNSKKAIALGLVGLMSLQGSLATSYAAEFSSSSVVSQELSSNSIVNEMISNGYLKLNSDNSLTVTEAYKLAVEHNLQQSGVHSMVAIKDNALMLVDNTNADEGVTKIEFTCKGFDIYLDHHLCRDICDSVKLTAIILGMLPDVSQAMKVVAGIGGLGAFVVERQDLGRGVIIAFILLVPHWVSSQ